jgi:hypothetical protein
VVQAKTDAGIREVDMTPALQELLSDYRLRSHYRGANSPVFSTSRGKRENPSNVRNRFLAAPV